MPQDWYNWYENSAPYAGSKFMSSLNPMSWIGDIVKPIAGGVGGYIAGQNSPDIKSAYSNYSNRVGDISKEYDPYISTGQSAFKNYYDMAMQGAQDPTEMIDKISSSYSTSPYQAQLLKDTQKMMNENAATTGMTGSTSANRALQSSMMGMQDQFMQQYLQNALNQYNRSQGNIFNVAQMGYGGLGQKTGLERESALGRAKAEMTPTKKQQSIWDTIGGIVGGIL
jgi:hypothetical protein